MAKSGQNIQDILQNVIGDASFESAGDRHVRLWTVLPSVVDGTGGTEVTGGSYSSVEIHGTSHFPAVGATDTEVSNDVAVTFPTATAGWGTVVGYTISKLSTGTSFLRIVSMPSTVIDSGTTATFAIGSIVIRET